MNSSLYFLDYTVRFKIHSSVTDVIYPTGSMDSIKLSMLERLYMLQTLGMLLKKYQLRHYLSIVQVDDFHLICGCDLTIKQ